MKKDIAVIGGGVFGIAIIEQLIKAKVGILVIDKKENTLNKLVSNVTKTAIADAADLRALEGLGLRDFETVIVATTNNIEIVAALLELKIKTIIARAKTHRHARVLRKIGVNIIIRPEEEAGIRTALIATNDNFIKYSQNLQEIGDGYVIGSTQLTNPDFHKLSIEKLNFNQMMVSIVLVKRNTTSVLPIGSLKLLNGDIITFIGKVENITKIFEVVKLTPDHVWVSQFGNVSSGKDITGTTVYRDQHSEKGWSIDHIKPLNLSGSNKLENLQVLDSEENRARGDDYPTWIDTKGVSHTQYGDQNKDQHKK